MTFKRIIIDTSNVYYRVKAAVGKQPSKQSMVSLAFKLINEDWNGKADEICLCFDPLPTNVNDILSVGDVKQSNDLKSYRKSINSSYKKNREVKLSKDSSAKKLQLNTFSETKSANANANDLALKMDFLLALYREYIQSKYEGKVSVYHSQKYEADDYCEVLTRAGDCCLVTSDMDWSRYLSRHCIMIKKGLSLDDQYTADDFKKEHGYAPTVATVTLMKSFYGDKSDNITGSLMLSKIKVYRSIADKIKAAILAYDNDDLYKAKLDILGQKGAFADPLKSLAESLTDKGYATVINTTLSNADIIDSLIYDETTLRDCYVRLSIDYDSPALQTKKIVFNTF